MTYDKIVPLSQDAMQRAMDAEKLAKQQAAASTTTSKSKWAQQKYSGTLLLHITATTSCCCHTASTSVLIAATAIATAGRPRGRAAVPMSGPVRAP